MTVVAQQRFFVILHTVCRRFLFLFAFLMCGCARLDTLTPELLDQAEQKWKAHEPVTYRLVIEMSGDRVETGRFEVMIREGQVATLRRNGLGIAVGSGQDYSMPGLFRMLRQELGLAEKPTMLGAPGGYSVYLQAQFDQETGRLIRYRRSVGGTSNTIDVNVVEYGEN
jgi:hypothetical protein